MGWQLRCLVISPKRYAIASCNSGLFSLTHIWFRIYMSSRICLKSRRQTRLGGSGIKKWGQSTMSWRFKPCTRMFKMSNPLRLSPSWGTKACTGCCPRVCGAAFGRTAYSANGLSPSWFRPVLVSVAGRLGWSFFSRLSRWRG